MPIAREIGTPSRGPTRRQFLKGAAGLSFAFTFAPGTYGPRAVAAEAAAWQVNAYVNIAPGGTVTIYSPSAEMGQGTLTALPLIVAEELDADWNRCRVAPSPPAGEVYGDPVFLDMIFTVASRSVSVYYQRLRLFGAQARQVLLLNAAARWDVPVTELETEPGVVVHEASGRRLGYGEIARFGSVPAELPQVDPARLKTPADFRLIGRLSDRKDLSDKVDGALQYSTDVALPGMLYAAVTRAPIHGAHLSTVRENGARDMPGVVGVYRRDHQVAVVADKYFRAMNARGKLDVEWARVGAVNDYDSVRAIEDNAAAAHDLSRKGFPWDAGGDLETGFERAVEVFEREYRTDYMYHAAMEPLGAVVWVKDGGASAEVWAGTQAPGYTLDTVASAAGVDREKVTVHRSRIGGAFGRRSIYGMDFVEDAAWLSRELDRPVKVIWTREDDVANGYFRPMTAQLLRAGLDADGAITAWHHRVAAEDPIKRFEPLLYEGWNGAPLIAMHGSEHQGMDGSPLPYAYDLPDRLAEYVEVETGIRVYAMRGVGSMPNKFAIESFIDELAEKLETDPLAFRLVLLHRSERARRVVQTAAEMAKWGKPRSGTALGMSYSHHADSMLACVVEAGLDESSGQIRVDNVWIAADVGIAIQPRNVEAQLEGGAMFGLSNALMERITIHNGIAQQSNFHDYPVLRMSSAPAIRVRLLRNDAPPTGVGETGTIVAAAALANAFAALTGERLRHMPFTPDRVKALLA